MTKSLSPLTSSSYPFHKDACPHLGCGECSWLRSMAMALTHQQRQTAGLQPATPGRSPLFWNQCTLVVLAPFNFILNVSFRSKSKLTRTFVRTV
jgi:hypothetical protein